MRSLLDAVLGALLDAWATLMPVDCVGCGVDDRVVCAGCATQLQAQLRLNRLGDGTPVLSALVYRGIVQQAILAFKEHGRTDAARSLSVPLAVALETVLGGAGVGTGPAVELALIPTSRKAYRRRGYDPIALVMRRTGYRPTRGIFVPARGHNPQKRLGRVERSMNLAGRLRVRRLLHGRRFVLVDDVLTTGSTLLEASRTIRAAGGEVVSAVTLAYTPLRNTPVSDFSSESDDKHRWSSYGE